ncbi:Nance-Horan syndrome protein isoform X2 [Alosa alosa]|uniref:Nance-Horan syndrome protein isoform X2 n=1 Tax=Alosa alosa TaxID=278164 RepID=UPI00201534FF|nr:Nance-Horan syndrome protein isoform X2 [Alosa alosa]
MIAYVDCLSTEPSTKCWNRRYYEDEDELLPLYSHRLQPKTEGSLRRRLLTSKIHQQQDALWAPRPLAGPVHRKGTPLLQPRRPPNPTPTHARQERSRAVSSLDDESKWTVHYQAPWHQQENVFLPGARPPCVEDLHKQAKVNLKTALRECDNLRKDGFRSSQYYTQGPAFSSSSLSDSVHSQPDTEQRDKKSSDSSPEEESLVYIRAHTPLIEDMNGHDSSIYSSWNQSFPLPTPEEKMRQQAKSVLTDIVPINITGETFDRQASFRRSLVNTDTVIRRPKKVRRRKTITGVPDNIQRELAPQGEDGGRAHSMYLPGQYSSLGRTSSINSTLRRSLTRDSSCQTEEVKIVPPSMRRIRAQRGQGIAAQMANISTSSSGSLSAASDCNGLVFTPQTQTQSNSSDQGFHSLPRPGTRTAAQSDSGNYTAGHYRMTNGSSHSLPHQVAVGRASDHSLHPAASLRTNGLPSPKFQGYQSEQHITASPSDYAGLFNGPTSLSAKGLMLSPPDFEGSAYENSGIYMASMEPFPVDGPPSTPGSSRCQSTASVSTGANTETDSQCSTLDGRNCSSPSYTRRESNSSTQSCGTLTSDPWGYDNVTPPKPDLTSSCSSPVNHLYGSSEHSPNKTDTSSLYSVDNEGYFTSMRLDSGLKSHSHSCISRADQARHDIYECRKHHSQDDRISLGSSKSLSRSISLRKAKKPPRPPARTDSLRRKARTPHLNESVLNEKLISSLQQSLQGRSQSVSLAGESPSAGGGHFEDPWVLRPRTHSNVSAASSGMSAPAAMCPVTPPPHSDNSSQRSDYTESWDFCSEKGLPQSSSNGMTDESLPNGAAVTNGMMSSDGMTNGSSQNGHKMCLPLVHVNTVNGPRSKTTSPEKMHRLTSPSSGYSSQSNTPTTGTPTTSGMRAKSPGKPPKPKPKPKVPERSSSLLSSLSVSSSSTSLSSTTSDTGKLPMPPPPPPLPGPTPPASPSATSDSPPPTMESPKCDTTLSPPLTPQASVIDNDQTSPPATPTVAEISMETLHSSPGFPSPPPPVEVTLESLLQCSNTSLLPPPPPPPPLPPSPSSPSGLPTPPPLPPLLGIRPPSAPVFKLPPRSVQQAVDMEKVTTPPSPGHHEETAMWPRPLITAEALQMVQLRSVKNLKVQEGQDEEPTASPSAEEQVQELDHDEKILESEELKKSIIPVHLSLTTCSSPIENGMEFPPSPLRERLLIPDRENTLVIPHRENPLVIPDRENPLMIPDKENPLMIPDRENLVVIPDRENPLVIPDRENALVISDRENPLMILDRENPLVIPESLSGPEAMEKGTICNGKSDDHISETHDEPTGEPSVQPDDKPMSLESQSPLMASPVTPRKQKPPVSPNKPKLSLIVPPLPSLSCLEVECVQVPNTDSPVASSPDVPPLFEVTGGQCFTLHQEDGEDTDSGSSTPMLLTQRRDSLSSELSSEGLPPGMHIQDLIIQEQDLGLSDERSTSDEDDLAASSGSSSFREEEQSVVADSHHSSPAPDASTNGEAHGDMVTPTRPRTTEDLFAVIHRSKRKVLGRGDCEELLLSSPSPPVTPTGVSPGGPPHPHPSLSLPRQPGSIQRSLRRSSTSSDSFKALLLKKGSRTEGSFRMSAAEMLKCTDPRKQRPQRTDATSSSSTSPSVSSQWPSSSSLPSPSHVAPPDPVENGVDSSCLSPGRSRRAVADEWARSEGLVPRLSPGLCSSSFSLSPTSAAAAMPPGKYARSRTPPSAASSRYNARSRIPSSPMTAICEREGEMSDGYEDQWESSARTIGQHRSPFSLAMSPSPTLCKGGSA